MLWGFFLNKCYLNDLELFVFLIINFYFLIVICFKILVFIGFFFFKIIELVSFKLIRYKDIYDVRFVIFNFLM